MIMQLLDGEHAWARQHGESSRAYGAFCIFRDMGPRRTITGAAEKIGVAQITLTTARKRWNWDARAEAWDEFNNRIYQSALVHERIEAAKRQVRIAESMLEKAEGRLETLDSNELSPDQVVKFIDSAIKAQRLALGMGVNEVKPAEQSGDIFNVLQILSSPEATKMADALGAKVFGHAARALDAGDAGDDDAGEPGIESEWREMDAGATPGNVVQLHRGSGDGPRAEAGGGLPTETWQERADIEVDAIVVSEPFPP